MTATEKAAAKGKMPKGGRKGGTTFPRLPLKQALEYSDKLVSKTHTGALPEATILAGVFDNAGPLGQVRASALKQYGLMEGDKTAYKATKLAQEIDAALSEEKPSLLQKALLNSKPFQEIFETFRGDTVSRARIRQRAQALKVHPDSADECAGIFVESAETSGLGKFSGEDIVLVQGSAETASKPAVQAEQLAGVSEVEDLGDEREGTQGALPKTGTDAAVTGGVDAAKPGVVLNLNVDSSSDPEKLRKQLELLRQFKLI